MSSLHNMDSFYLLGCHRVLQPANTLPQPAWQLDNTPIAHPTETLVDVHMLHIDSASFAQIASACNYDTERMKAHIQEIVKQRGKMHNPITGSGGVLLGTIVQLDDTFGKRHQVAPGDTIISLTSLSWLPLSLTHIHAVHLNRAEVEVEGKAIFFRCTPLLRLPNDFPRTVLIAVLDVAGAPARAAALVRPGQRVTVLGAGGTAGLLTLCAIRKRLGKSGRLLAVECSEGALQDIATLDVADQLVKGDATQPLQLLERVREACQGQDYEADLTINVVNVPNTELASILLTEPHGRILFFSMATDFTTAALGAEGMARPVEMHIGNGYVPGHAQTTLQLLQDYPTLFTLFDKRFQAAPTMKERERLHSSLSLQQKDPCIHELIEAQIKRTPDAVALVYQDEHLTYQKLDIYTTRLAACLQAQGVGPDVLVGLYMQRCLEMVIGLVGILKAGGAYVPLDPQYPQERLDFMLRDARVRVVLTRHDLLEKLPAPGTDRIGLKINDLISIRVESSAPGTYTKKVCSENLAYVIYTSGSTGRPKGVQIPHRAVTNFLSSMQSRPGLTDQDILLSVTTFSFDIAYLEIFLPLITGARLVIASLSAANGFRLDPALKESGATVMQATPATWNILTRIGWRNKGLQKLLCGGEALTYDLAHLLLEQAPELWNLYGPTETTIWSTVARIENSVISLGQPITNTQIYLLDSSLQQITDEAIGEVYIGGAGLARGYLGRPDLTAERFVPNPFSNQPGERLYRTGDLARYLPDGSLEYRGRIDQQVKLRGFRIELGEIEAVLSQHHTVRQCSVVLREDLPTNKRLVAYCVAERGQQPDINELRRFMRQHLPDYMMPEAIVLLEALPLTPNGKVNRKALPPPTLSSQENSHL